MKLHEFFFFLQAHAGIFFSSSISCMNFFFGSDTPRPRISNSPPLTDKVTVSDGRGHYFRSVLVFEPLCNLWT